MRNALAASLLVAAMALSGCDLFEAPARGGGDTTGRASVGDAPSRDAAFAHSQSDDISGSYRPVGMTGADDFELSQVFIGQDRDFRAWEAGQRSGGFAPVMMELTVIGGETLRVLPERYAVSDGRVSMRGTVEGMGEVSFDARLDKGALATARRNLGDTEAPAMTGVVRLGGQTFSGVKFSWYGGD